MQNEHFIHLYCWWALLRAQQTQYSFHTDRLSLRFDSSHNTKALQISGFFFSLSFLFSLKKVNNLNARNRNKKKKQQLRNSQHVQIQQGKVSSFSPFAYTQFSHCNMAKMNGVDESCSGYRGWEKEKMPTMRLNIQIYHQHILSFQKCTDKKQRILGIWWKFSFENHHTNFWYGSMWKWIDVDDSDGGGLVKR